MESDGSLELFAKVTGPTGSVNLKWAAVPGATSYKIYRTSTSGTYGASSLSGTATTANYTDTGSALTSGKPIATTTNLRVVGSSNGAELKIEEQGNVTAQLTIQRNQSGGSFNGAWALYIPASSTDLRLFNAAPFADLFSISQTGATWFRNSTNSTAAFQIQSATGSDTLFTVNTTNNRLDVGNATGTDTNTTLFVLDSATADPTTNLVNGAMYYNSSTNKFRCRQGGAWTDCIGTGGGGGTTKTIKLSPEFAGGALHADGTNNTGTMTSEYTSGLSLAQGYKHNYYQWTATGGTAQDYDIVVNTQIPSDFNVTNGLTNWNIWGYTSNTSNATATIQVQDVDGTNCYASPVSITPSTTTTWEEKSVGAMSGCSFAPNDMITITIHVVSQSNAVFRVGEVRFDYTN
jgi:hypothetical protein